MSHPPLSVIRETSWAGELFVFLLAASDIGRSGNQNTSQGLQTMFAVEKTSPCQQ